MPVRVPSRLVIALPLLLAACHHDAQAKTHAAAHAVISSDEAASFVERDGVRIEIDPALSFKTTPGAAGIEHRVADEALEVSQGHLRLGGRDYGTVSAGDRVVIGEHGVLVDGVRREPTRDD
ncbi:MAG: hypothetical protein H6825_13775 [Planctomycetes bacterium]|nr:hypothetical protein [Planctomycetota bacterium]